MSSPVSTTGPARRMPRWAGILLIASLAINLFVVGVVARSVWPWRYAAASAVAGGGGGGMVGNMLAYAATLPDERRKAIRQALPNDRPMMMVRPLRKDLRQARREAALAFRQEPFDREAFLAAEGRVQAAEAKLRQTIVQLAADLAGRMTAEERAGFLKWRELRRPGGAGNQADNEPDKEPPAKKPAE
jgi:uncharacterized membrane protein